MKATVAVAAPPATDLPARAAAMRARLAVATDLTGLEIRVLQTLLEELDRVDRPEAGSLRGSALVHEEAVRAARSEERRISEERAVAKKAAEAAARIERWRATPKVERVLWVVAERGTPDQQALAHMLLSLISEGDEFDERLPPADFETRLRPISRRPV